MKVFQWDSSSNEITVPYECTAIEVSGLKSLSLEQKMRALNNRVEVVVDQWTYPSKLVGFSQSESGTCMVTGTYDRDYGFVLACNMGDDRKALEELTRFVAEELKEYDTPPGLPPEYVVEERPRDERGDLLPIPEDIELGEPEEQEDAWTADQQHRAREIAGDDLDLPNFVAVNVEGDDTHVSWFAYFRSDPTPQDLERVKLELAHRQPRSDIFETPEREANQLSVQAGLCRFRVAGVI